MQIPLHTAFLFPCSWISSLQRAAHFKKLINLFTELDYPIWIAKRLINTLFFFFLLKCLCYGERKTSKHLKRSSLCSMVPSRVVNVQLRVSSVQAEAAGEILDSAPPAKNTFLTARRNPSLPSALQSGLLFFYLLSFVLLSVQLHEYCNFCSTFVTLPPTFHFSYYLTSSLHSRTT